MAKFTRTTSLLAPARKSLPRGILLTAAGATATLELLDGVVGKAATVAIDTAGTGYEVGDVITLPSLGGEDATVTVATVGGSGEITGVTLTTPGSGFNAAEVPASQTTDSTLGADAVISITTVEDDSTTESVAKISAVANTSVPLDLSKWSVETDRGLSIKLTGSGAIGYVYKE